MDTLVQVLPASIERLGIWRLSRRQETIKRAEDLILASLLLLLLTPLMAAAALAVKLTTPGPVLFRQRRVGQDGEVIEVLKFRTMYADRCDPNAAQQTRRNDPRITPVGRFLRRFSL